MATDTCIDGDDTNGDTGHDHQHIRTAFGTCPLCEAGCGLEITVSKGDDGCERVTRIRGDREALPPVSTPTRSAEPLASWLPLADHEAMDPLSGTSVPNGIPVEVGAL